MKKVWLFPIWEMLYGRRSLYMIGVVVHLLRKHLSYQANLIDQWFLSSWFALAENNGFLDLHILPWAGITITGHLPLSTLKSTSTSLFNDCFLFLLLDVDEVGYRWPGSGYTLITSLAFKPHVYIQVQIGTFFPALIVWTYSTHGKTCMHVDAETHSC